MDHRDILQGTQADMRHQRRVRTFRFVGCNENAVKWQVWIALLAHLLLRFLSFTTKWKPKFSRLAGVVRSAVMLKRDLYSLLALQGTAQPAKNRIPLALPFAIQLLLPLRV
jgi:hypothetical protein